MGNKTFHNFVDSIRGFADLKKIDQITWFVFYKFEKEKSQTVDKEDIRPLFSLAWLEEPKNLNGLWSYLHGTKKVLVRKDKGFVLNREVYKRLQKSYLTSLPTPKVRKELKRVGKGNIVKIPAQISKKFPKDLVRHCNELNDNLDAENWISSMLLMRKILPLSIIRKFQKDNKEANLKDSNNEYFGSKKLLEKAKNLVQPRTFKELGEIRFLFDSIQHNFKFLPRKTDISPASIRLRVFLEELFG